MEWSGRTALRRWHMSRDPKTCSGVYSTSLACSLKLMDVVWARGRDGWL